MAARLSTILPLAGRGMCAHFVSIASRSRPSTRVTAATSLAATHGMFCGHRLPRAKPKLRRRYGPKQAKQASIDLTDAERRHERPSEAAGAAFNAQRGREVGQAREAVLGRSRVPWGRVRRTCLRGYRPVSGSVVPFNKKGVGVSPSPEPPVTQIAALYRADFDLLPLGGGEDGKSPLLRFDGKRIPQGQCLRRMRDVGSAMYGVRLNGLVVIDADEFGPETEDYVTGRFGPATVQVATPRGRHFYYRLADGPLPNLRGEGLPYDVKSGANAYVAGPGSVRRDGGEYTAILGDLAATGLEPIRLPVARVAESPLSVVSTEPIPEGGRHDWLKTCAASLAWDATSEADLCANLTVERDRRCEAGAHPIADAEVQSLASWAWKARCNGTLFAGRHSSVPLLRSDLDRFSPLRNGGDALLLLSQLRAAHGHSPGKRFAVDFPGMTASGLIAFSRERFIKARQVLLAMGYLVKQGSYVPGKVCQHYQLALPDADVGLLGKRGEGL